RPSPQRAPARTGRRHRLLQPDADRARQGRHAARAEPAGVRRTRARAVLPRDWRAAGLVSALAAEAGAARQLPALPLRAADNRSTQAVLAVGRRPLVAELPRSRRLPAADEARDAAHGGDASP